MVLSTATPPMLKDKDIILVQKSDVTGRLATKFGGQVRVSQNAMTFATTLKMKNVIETAQVVPGKRASSPSAGPLFTAPDAPNIALFQLEASDLTPLVLPFSTHPRNVPNGGSISILTIDLEVLRTKLMPLGYHLFLAHLSLYGGDGEDESERVLSFGTGVRVCLALVRPEYWVFAERHMMQELDIRSNPLLHVDENQDWWMATSYRLPQKTRRNAFGQLTTELAEYPLRLSLAVVDRMPLLTAQLNHQDFYSRTGPGRFWKWIAGTKVDHKVPKCPDCGYVTDIYPQLQRHYNDVHYRQVPAAAAAA